MVVLPSSLPQELHIQKGIGTLDNPENENSSDKVLQAATLIQANVLLVLTETRVLVYHYKPLALIACHERSPESLKEFGRNKALFTSNVLPKAIKGLGSQKSILILNEHQGKIIFYISTSNSYLLAYQILRNASVSSTFLEYGVTESAEAWTEEEGGHYNNMEEAEDQFEDENGDDEDVLVVFDKNKSSSRVIQNGYVTSRRAGFFNFLRPFAEPMEELSVKRIELRLKLVLKFDFDIIDVLGFKRTSGNDTDKDSSSGTPILDEQVDIEDWILILFPHGLQLLNLNHHNLHKNDLVKIEGGCKILAVNDGIFVAQLSKDEDSTNLQKVNFPEGTARILEHCAPAGQLVACFEYTGRAALITKRSLTLIDTITEKIQCTWRTPFEVRTSKLLAKDTVGLISTSGRELCLYTIYGNCLFSYSLPEGETISDLIYLDKKLVILMTSGVYQIWPMWSHMESNKTDFRRPSASIFINSANDIGIFRNFTIEKDSAAEPMQIIKLPTRTLNNVISLVRISPNGELLAVYIPNKGLLLIMDIKTNVWHRTNELAIVDMHWVEDTYLLCHLRDMEGKHVLECFHIPLQDFTIQTLKNYMMWEYQGPEKSQIQKVLVNSLYRYKQVKVKPVNKAAVAPVFEEILHKTSEIILVTQKGVTIFDVIATVHPGGMNIIKNIHEHSTFGIPEEIPTSTIAWIMTFKDGLIFLHRGTITRLLKNGRYEVCLKNVERIVDAVKGKLYLIHKNRLEVISLEEMWNGHIQPVVVELEDCAYPVTVSPELAVVHNLFCVMSTDQTLKLRVNHEIYLDRVISHRMGLDNDSLQAIHNDYCLLRHYNFALEKMLSFKILNDEPLHQIIELIKLSNNSGSGDSEENKVQRVSTTMLHIISNCLRKIEKKYWGTLFKQLRLSPRDLLAECIERRQVTTLGILLLVFLNFNEDELIRELRSEDKLAQAHTKAVPSNSTTRHTSDLATATALEDEELMLHVLRILVNGAAETTDEERSAETWDMCFQLIRLLTELDKQNGTTLVSKAVAMLG